MYVEIEAKLKVDSFDVVQSRLTSFHATVPAWHERRATGGGVLMELAIHHVDLWRWLTGDEVDEVFAYARTGEREDESAVLVARMGSGALATAGFWRSSGPITRLPGRLKLRWPKTN